MPIITGSENPDVLVGTLGDDTIVALSGDDSVVAGRGDNIIFGNQGNDILRAGRGQDTLLGGRDNDQLFGNEQNNILSGDVGDDTLFAVDGENFLFGNDGSDVLVAGLGNDFLYGGQGDDTIWAERGNNVISGDRGADVLIGGTGENIFVININQGGPEIADAEQILRFKPNDKLALVGGPDGQTLDKSAINIAFVRTDANSTRGNYVLSNLATGEFLAVIRNVRRSALTDESFTEEIVPSDTPDPGPPQPPVVDPEDELPPAPDPGDTTTDPQPPPTPGPGTPPVVEPPVDEDDPDDPADPDDPDDPTDPDDPDDPVDPIDPEDNTPPTVDDKELEPDLDLKTSRRKEAQLTGNDIDGQDLTFEIVTQPSNGTIPSASFNASTGEFTYFPNVGFLGEDTFEYRAFDGIAYSDKATITVNVSVSSPIIDLDKQETGVDTSATYIEGQGAVNVAGSNIFLAAPNNEISKVEVTLVNPSGESQILTLDDSVSADIDGSGVQSGDNFVVTLEPSSSGSNAPASSYAAVLNTIKFQDPDLGNPIQDPEGGDRTVNFVVTDNDSDTASATSTITVTPVNDPPQIGLVEPSGSASKNVAYNLDNFVDPAGPPPPPFSDVDAGNNPVEVKFTVNIGEISYDNTFTETDPGWDVQGSGTSELIVKGSLTDINTAIVNGYFSYSHDSEGEAQLTVTLSDNGNTGKVFDGGGNEIDNVQTVSVAQDFEVVEQTFEGITEMMFVDYTFGFDNLRNRAMPATAFLKSGDKSAVSTIEITSTSGTIENGISSLGPASEITFDQSQINEGAGAPKFTYTLRDEDDNPIVEDIEVEVFYSPKIVGSGEGNPHNQPSFTGREDGINLLIGAGRNQVFIGGDYDDHLIGFAGQGDPSGNILYGGQGNDTLVGLAEEGETTRDTFVFDRSDFLTGEGFNATDIDAIRNHPHYNTITTFNWGDGKDLAVDMTTVNDVIWLSGFEVDGDPLNFEDHINADVFFDSTNPVTDRLSVQERVFMVVDEGEWFLLYDEDGDVTSNDNTHIIAKFTGNSDSNQNGAGILSEGDFHFANFDPTNPPTPPFPIP